MPAIVHPDIIRWLVHHLAGWQLLSVMLHMLDLRHSTEGQMSHLSEPTSDFPVCKGGCQVREDTESGTWLLCALVITRRSTFHYETTMNHLITTIIIPNMCCCLSRSSVHRCQTTLQWQKHYTSCFHISSWNKVPLVKAMQNQLPPVNTQTLTAARTPNTPFKHAVSVVIICRVKTTEEEKKRGALLPLYFSLTFS